MDGRLKQVFFQRRHIDSQKVHEKMLNITNLRRNANQNYNEVSLHTVRMVIIKKNLQTIIVEKGVEKREPSSTVARTLNWYSHYGEQYRGFIKN